MGPQQTLARYDLTIGIFNGAFVAKLCTVQKACVYGVYGNKITIRYIKMCANVLCSVIVGKATLRKILIAAAVLCSNVHLHSLSTNRERHIIQILKNMVLFIVE